MAGIELMLERAERVPFTKPPVSETLAVIVRDHRRSEFETAGKVEKMDSGKFAVRTERNHMERMADWVPRAHPR